MRAAKQDKSSRGTPPSVRWTLLPHSLLLLSSPLLLFPALPSSILLHYSSVCWESPAHGSAAAAPADLPSPLDLLLAYPRFFPSSTHRCIPPSPGMERQNWPLSAAERERETVLSCSFRHWKGDFFLPFLPFCIFTHWITVLALHRNEKTGSKMPEANYLLSVSWGYIKVCGAYLRSLSGYRTLLILLVCTVLLLCNGPFVNKICILIIPNVFL